MSPLLGPLRRRRTPGGPSNEVVRQIRIVVAGGYHPEVIRVEARVPLRLIFRREESSTCSEQVIFPSLGKSASLPQYQNVPIDIMIAEPGVHDFTCAMGMLHGRIIVAPPKGFTAPRAPIGGPGGTEWGERP